MISGKCPECGADVDLPETLPEVGDSAPTREALEVRLRRLRKPVGVLNCFMILVGLLTMILIAPAYTGLMLTLGTGFRLVSYISFAAMFVCGFLGWYLTLLYIIQPKPNLSNVEKIAIACLFCTIWFPGIYFAAQLRR